VLLNTIALEEHITKIKRHTRTIKERARRQALQLLQLSVSWIRAIDTAEDGDIATVDISCVFMQAEMDEIVHLQIGGKMADPLTEVQPEK
jgi:hypothetical protein